MNQQLLIALLLMMASVANAATNTPPNILWLIAEDFGPHLGCYGTKEVWTPNIDSLARDGVRFDRFFCTAPVCSASRSAFMTGMYQTTIGAQNHRSHRDDGYELPSGVRVLTDWLRDGGYFTVNIRQMPEPITFRGTGKTDWNFSYNNRSTIWRRNIPSLEDKQYLQNEKSDREAAGGLFAGPKKTPFDSDKWNDLKSHQPFYAQLNFQETHRAFHAPKRADPAKVELPPYYPDHEITRRDWAEYLDAATELDRKIGLVLKRLEADGLADNTVIVFFGDNGQAHVRGKQFCYEEGLLVPLMIRWPKGIPAPKNLKPGTINRQLIEAIDLAPTMLDFAGLSKPAKMQGRVFAGEHAEAAREYAFGARDRCDETVFRLRTVRDSRYRYIRNFTSDRPFLQPNEYKEKQYPVWNLIKDLARENKLTPEQAVLAAPTMPEEELYDLQTDPHEVGNLAHSPQHADVLKRLRGVLEKWIIETDDKGRVLESAELVTNKGLVHTNANPIPATRRAQ